MLTSTTLKDPRQLHTRLALLQKYRADEPVFSDHLDHLQAIEEEVALLVLARSAHRQQQSPARPSSHVSTEDKTDTCEEQVSPRMLLERYENCKQANRQRESASRQSGVRLTFLELCENFQLDDLERLYVQVLLLQATSPSFRALLEELGFEENHYQGTEGVTIGVLLEISCLDFRDQLEARRYFSVDGTLVKKDLVEFDNRRGDGNNILAVRAQLNDSCIRYCLGDTNLYDATFKFVRREMGKVRLDQVILPDAIKQEVVQRVESFYQFQASERATQLEAFYGYGTGLAMIFHGPSGTGKTMLAQALSHHFERPLFYLTEQNLHDMPGAYDDIFQAIFQEANLHGGIVFFDEADDLFQEGSTISRELLISLEQSRCVTILATNKPIELDPAMERRLGLKLAFDNPDAAMRQQIWKKLLPDFITCAKDIDTTRLAEDYPFSGGLIKNALVMGIANALQDSTEAPVLTQKQLVNAARLQMRRVVEENPLVCTGKEALSLNELAVSTQNRRQLEIAARICRSVHQDGSPLRFVFQGQSATGLEVAIALAKTCELRARVVNLSTLSRYHVENKKVMDPGTQKEVDALDLVFSEHYREGTILVFHDHASFAPHMFRHEENGKPYGDQEFMHRLAEFRGICCLVTPGEPGGLARKLFDFSLAIGHPETSNQVSTWEDLLPGQLLSEEQLLDIVEKYPMQRHEIETVIRRARYLGLLEGGEDTFDADLLAMALENYHHVTSTPILFGE